MFSRASSGQEDIPASEVFEDHLELKDSWLVRPCEWYREELKECKRILGRFHQYFIFGHSLDCSQWKEDYGNCINYRKRKDMDSLDKVIASELKRREARFKASSDNDVWTPRTSPPKHWNRPLPIWFQEQTRGSYLHMKQRQKEEAEKK